MDDKDAILILDKLIAPIPDIRPDTVAVFVSFDEEAGKLVSKPISMDEIYEKSSG